MDTETLALMIVLQNLAERYADAAVSAASLANITFADDGDGNITITRS